jgi:2,3-bisphosphoglycerate-dependent phosphoglycerate mutase
MGGGSLEKCTSWMNPKYINRERYLQTKRVPVTESLKQCQERAYYFWQNTIAPRVKSGDRVLIVAHANTIRALVKAVDNIDDDSISHLRIPNGIPLVYTLDENLKPVVNLSDDIGFHANYLVSARNHSKVRRRSL